MENLMIRNQTRMSPSSTPSPPALSINRDSKTISKPKIRIIHIFAPEIIKTDVANFRELVQRLTGKPPQQKGCIKNKPKFSRKDHSFRVEKPRMELRTGFIQGLVKEEEGMLWGNTNNIGENNSSGNFLSGLGDLDGFIQELREFPLLPLDHIHGFEEAQFA